MKMARDPMRDSTETVDMTVQKVQPIESAPSLSGRSEKQPDPMKKIVDLSVDVWTEQFKAYLDGKEFVNHSVPDDPRSLKSRAMSVGLDEFDALGKDGKLTKQDLKNDVQLNPFRSLDPLGMQVLLGNFELVDKLDGKQDGAITKIGLAALSGRDVQLQLLPSDRKTAPLKSDDPRAVAKNRTETEEIIGRRLDQMPTHSQGNFFDTSVKSMAKAILNGDVDTFNKMVEEFNSHHQLLERAAVKLDYLLSASGVRVRYHENKSVPTVAISSDSGTVCFTPQDKPYTTDLARSPQELMDVAGYQTSLSNSRIAQRFASEDAEGKARAADKKVIESLETELNAGEKKLMTEILGSARKGDMAAFQNRISTAARLDSNGLYNVAEALNELVRDQDIRFIVTNDRGSDAKMQIRNRTGDRSLTITARHNLVVGLDGVRSDRTGDTIPELTKWVYESIKTGRESFAPGPGARLSPPKRSDLTGAVYDSLFPKIAPSKEDDFWKQMRQARER